MSGHEAAVTALTRLPQPWAIKDPRFAETLQEWLLVLVRYQPLLLWATKDHDLVVESYVRRGTLWERAERRVKQREAACARHFADWPWRRLTVDAAEIRSAVGLYDAAR